MAPLATHDLPQVAIEQLKISPDGTTIAVAARRQVDLFRVDGLTPAGSVGPHPVDVRALAFSPDGRTLATATESNDDFARLWDTASGHLVAELRDVADAQTLQFSPDSKTLAVGSGDWVAVLWHLDPDDVVRRLCAIAVPDARDDRSAVPKPCR